MSEGNVETVLRAFETFRAGLAASDPAASFDEEVVSEDLEWVLPPGGPGFRSVYRGREGFIEFMRTWTEDFDWRIDIEELKDAGFDRVVGIFRQHAIGRASGVPVDLRSALLYELRGGRIVRITNFLDPDEALRAAGLDG